MHHIILRQILFLLAALIIMNGVPLQNAFAQAVPENGEIIEEQQPAPQAAPVTEVITEPVTPDNDNDSASVKTGAPAAPKATPAIFVELYSSQACLFCPQADRLFADLLGQSDIFGFSCHVDYFKVRDDKLARPFCTDRQKWYMQTLKTGPQYTPQMIINGQHDVIGYKIDEVMQTIEAERENRIFVLNIVPSLATKGAYDFILPAMELTEKADMQIWLIIYNKTQDLTITDGRNRGKAMQYINVASRLDFLGAWDGTMGSRQIKPDLNEKHGGFLILIQDKNNGKIIAFGQKKLTNPAPDTPK